MENMLPAHDSPKMCDQLPTNDRTECANLLNNFFQQQFCQTHGIVGIPPIAQTHEAIEVSVKGVTKLITSLGNGKSPPWS